MLHKKQFFANKGFTYAFPTSLIETNRTVIYIDSEKLLSGAVRMNTFIEVLSK